jgi:endonuclease I
MVAVMVSIYVQSMGQVIHPGLSGQELIDALFEDYRPATVLTLAQAKDSIYASIDIQGDSVHGFYTDFAVLLEPGEDPSQSVFQNGNGINLEHGWPQSKGATEGTQAYMDMHHLFPTRVAVNSARGSFPFAEIPDDETTTWYYKGDALSSIPSSNIDAYSESVNGAFEPRESVKGDVARAMFYFFTMYRAQADAAAPGFFDEQRADLCNWHLADPADDREQTRNEKIAALQDGRLNPFVLDCTLARRAYCTGLTNCTSSTQNQATERALIEARSLGCRLIFTNVSTQNVEVSLDILNTAGQNVLADRTHLAPLDEIVRDGCALAAGLYIIQLKVRAGSNQQRVVHKVYIP